jgi:hypothetical protein
MRQVEAGISGRVSASWSRYRRLCVLRGEIHAKRGVQMDTVYRRNEPRRFRLTAAIYGGLTVDLFTIC